MFLLFPRVVLLFFALCLLGCRLFFLGGRPGGGFFFGLGFPTAHDDEAEGEERDCEQKRSS